MKKKRVLLVWFEVDKRPELLAPFVEMQNEIEFIHLAHRNRQEENNLKCSPFQKIYWFDYHSPKELLMQIKPDLLLGNTEGLLNIALINECRKRCIPTYGLQHGFSVKSIDEEFSDFKRDILLSKNILKKYFYITRFYFASFLNFEVKNLIQSIYIFILFYLNQPLTVIKNRPYYWLCPNFYVCFSEYASKHYKELYNLNNNKVLLTGVLCFDKLFKDFGYYQINKNSISQKYFILIDTCFDGLRSNITKKQINRCYLELAKYCEKQNAKLKIKLHPWSYNYTDLVVHPNIEFYKYLESTELNELIFNSEACFGFYSTLTLPLVAIKPLIQIKYNAVYEPILEDMNLANTIDFYTFTSKQIQFKTYSTDSIKRQEAITKLLFSTDGMATERLKNILLN